MKIFNIEINFDFADAEDLERFEREYPKTQKELEEVNINNEKASETIKQFCVIIRNFFNNVFGEGTANKIFGDRYNYRKCLEAFKEVVAEKDRQDKETDEAISYLENYSPDRAKRD